MNPFLIIDTSIDPNFILLCDEEKIFYKLLLPFGTKLSETFFPNIQRLLQDHQIRLKDLSFIFCSLGPGSFTGSRVGISFAQTVHYSLNIPVIGYSSLCSLTPPEDTPFISVLDAKSQGFFILEGNKKGAHIQFFTHPKRVKENIFPLPIVHLPSQFQKQTFIAPKIYQSTPNFSFLHTLALEKLKKKPEKASYFLTPYYLPIANNEKSVLV